MKRHRLLQHRGHTQFYISMLACRIESRDRYRALSLLAALGVPLVVLLAAFGQPPIGLHGPLHYLGIMAPTCGMTRGVMLVARGAFARAFAFNPASLVVLPAMALVLARAAYGGLSGRWLSFPIKRSRWHFFFALGALFALTVRQQLQAGFLLANLAG